MTWTVGRWPPVSSTRTISKPRSRTVGSISSGSAGSDPPIKKWAGPTIHLRFRRFAGPYMRPSSARLQGFSGAPEARRARSADRRSARPAAQRLLLVAGRRPVGGRSRQSRRALGQPDQLGPGDERQQHRARVAHVVGRQAQLAARRQQPGELGRGRRIDDPPLVVAGLGPGIGEQDEDALEAGVGQGASSRRASSTTTRRLSRRARFRERRAARATPAR